MQSQPSGWELRLWIAAPWRERRVTTGATFNLIDVMHTVLENLNCVHEFERMVPV